MLLTAAGIGLASRAAQLTYRRADGGDTLEHAALEHAVREFDVEFTFESEHHVDAGVRCHPGLVEVGLGAEGVDIAAQAAVVLENAADRLLVICCGHDFLR